MLCPTSLTVLFSSRTQRTGPPPAPLSAQIRPPLQGLRRRKGGGVEGLGDGGVGRGKREELKGPRSSEGEMEGRKQKARKMEVS